MHIIQKDGAITPSTDPGWQKCIKSLLKWKDSDIEESLMSEEVVQRFEFYTQAPAGYAIPLNNGYSKECYIHFNNITKIKAARERREKAASAQKKNGTKGWYQTLSVGQTFLLPQVVAERWQKIQGGVRWNG